VRFLVHGLDALLRRAYGVFEFCQEPDCLLRLQVGRAPRSLILEGQVVQAGEPVLLLHLWNEHLPRLPRSGPDLAWAKAAQRAFLRSLQAVAVYLQSQPELEHIAAVGGVTALLFTAGRDGGSRLMERLGFTVLPYRGPLGRFGEFWENFYSWMLIWAYNPAGLRYRPLFKLRRAEIWMLKADFIRRFGQERSASAPLSCGRTGAEKASVSG
jgi:hypothetical protein